MRPHDVLPRHIYKYLNTRVDKSGEKSRATALYEIRVFRHVFTKAVEWGILDRHPFKGEVRLGAVAARDRYVEDWEIAQALALKPKRDAGSVLMIQAYIRLKLLIGIRRGDMLRLQMRDLTDAGIVVRPHKTMHKRRTRRIFEWTPALEEAVSQAKAARPIDFSPWLFCTGKGKGYFPRVASTKVLPVGVVASVEMLPAIAPVTMMPPLIWGDYGNEDDARGPGRTDQRSP